MDKTKSLRVLLVLATVVLLSAPGLRAGDDSDFKFHLDPFVIGGLFTDVDTDSAKYEEYRDKDGSMVIPYFHLLGRDDERTLDFWARNVRRTDARYTALYRVDGKYSLLVDYNKIPHRFGNSAASLWTKTGDGVLEISDAVQQNLQDALETQFAADPAGIDLGFLEGLLGPYLAVTNRIDVGLQRDRTRARFDFGKMGPLAWGVELTHENRTGNRPLGASFGFGNATEVPEPIDYDTTGAELSGEWNADKAGVRFGYRYSKFENNVDTLIWDNPFRFTDATDSRAYTAPGSGSVGGPSRGRIDLAPDNEQGTFFVDGRARFGERAWMSGAVSYAVMTQNDNLVPYTINSAIDTSGGAPFDATNPANLPAKTADAEAKVLNANARFGLELGDRGDLTFHYLFQDYDNRSPRIEFPGYVRYDAVWEEIGRITVPYAWSKQDVGIDFGWQLGGGNHIGVGARRESWSRDYREIKDSDENVINVTFDSHAVDWLSLRARVERRDRSIGNYSTEAQELSFEEPEGINNQPGLRKFDEASRTSDIAALSAQFMPNDAIMVMVGLNVNNDDYDESEFGLITDEITRYNLEFDYTPSDKLNFFVFYERSDRKALQKARQSGGTLSFLPEDSWQLDVDEKTDTAGLGFSSKFAERWSANAGLNWSRSDGGADFYSPPGGTPDLAYDFGNYDDIELFAASVGFGVDVTDHAHVGVGYRYEDYTIDTFILQGLKDYLPGTLLLNGSDSDYTANVFFAKMKFTF